MLEQLERLLDSGERVGFHKLMRDPDYLGWILIAKLEANQRLLELFSDDAESPQAQEERRRLEKPFMVLDIELRRDVHEAGEYETESDYRRKTRLWFASLAEVERHLAELGYALTSARPARELDAP